jgi:hypothetical protein
MSFRRWCTGVSAAGGSRNVKSVHTGAQTLVNCRLINKPTDVKWEFPSRAVQVHFAVRAT